MQSSKPVQRIVLTGFMGSGKTTVGRLLAERLQWEFSDLDREVERRAGLTVPLIFAEQGESRFRELEADTLAELLPRTHLVLALGGGAPEFAAASQLLKNALKTLIVYLAAPLPTLAGRCRLEGERKDAVRRPIFEDAAEAQRRFARRQPLYESLAHVTVPTDGLTKEQVVAAVLEATHPWLEPWAAES